MDVYVAILEFSADSWPERPFQHLNAKLSTKEVDLRRWMELIGHQYRKLKTAEIVEKIKTFFKPLFSVRNPDETETLLLIVTNHAR